MSKQETRSPLPGIFYRKATPDSPPYKNDGDAVAAGDTIGLIEVMKSFHEVKAEVSGSAIRFVVDNEDAVMAGDVLAEIEG
ncbi:acetyl-CoA carboxylase [Mesorhizobium sp. LHD-90]|uniref:acetyl-CoA carboxylase n=1 Tax=Mesorhizobium sp. LHD-90 TaxID=3071414 RepID=UPI0027E0A14E|nr:acetyl-CoA carboxylase [Mesorhizobium sp. LHD-90]MDQ6435479.1 acetyl-CoA carboxylase [Mesorhizobium sp. LHD-90]